MEPATQDESPSSTAVLNCASAGAANGNGVPQSKYNHDREKDLIPANLWNTVSGKLSHKTGTVNTPDGMFISIFFENYLYIYLIVVLKSHVTTNTPVI